MSYPVAALEKAPPSHLDLASDLTGRSIAFASLSLFGSVPIVLSIMLEGLFNVGIFEPLAALPALGFGFIALRTAACSRSHRRRARRREHRHAWIGKGMAMFSVFASGALTTLFAGIFVVFFLAALVASA